MRRRARGKFPDKDGIDIINSLSKVTLLGALSTPDRERERGGGGLGERERGEEGG